MSYSWTLRTDVRPLAAGDLAEVVMIDAAIEELSRHAYFERRLEAARREPELHAQFAAIDSRGLAGHIMARVLEGEFGRSNRTLRLEAIGIRPDAQRHGIGYDLFRALLEWAGRHDIANLCTEARWNDFAILRWMDAVGFRRAPEQIVDCPVDGGAFMPGRNSPDTSSDEQPIASGIRFGREAANDFKQLVHDTVTVDSMSAEDLRDIVRIDHAITGRNRKEYLTYKFNESATDATVRISLSARLDDGLVIGFVMARVDLGDCGRTQPVAVIDTIAVDPGWSGRGVGRALLAQLFVRLDALRVEQIETIAVPENPGLLGFLYKTGFVPSQRIAFVRHFR